MTGKQDNQPDTRRRFLRHLAEIPIEVCCSDSTRVVCKNTHDISYGGLSFKSDRPIPLNQKLSLAIRVTQPNFEEDALVAWCKKCQASYEIGVEFIKEDAIFRIRMVEQICHIEKYRLDMREIYGRELSAEDAAIEWINEYAADFRPV